MNKEFFKNNRKRLVEGIKDNSIVVMFSGQAPHMSADADYNFVPNRNFYYLTGIDKQKVVLMLTKCNDRVSEILFIEKSDPVMARWIGERIKPEEAKEISGIEKIEYVDNFKMIFNSTVSGSYEHLYLDLERASWDSPLSDSHAFAKDVHEKYPHIVIKNIYDNIVNMRMIKSSEEIENIKKAIGITYDGIKNMMRNAKPGMMEYELEAYFDFSLKSHGVRQYAFDTIAASGKNGTVLHYSDNNCRTGENDLILFDLGAQYKYYCADITRTFPVSGRFTKRQREVYDVVLKALTEIPKAIRPGIKFSELNIMCKRILADGCRRLGLIKEDSELFEYYFHGVSHYLGLDTHDVGVYDKDFTLKPGMVLTVEPGLYIEKEAIGIRIEDDVLVTESGSEVLSKDIIRTADEIEEFMNDKK